MTENLHDIASGTWRNPDPLPAALTVAHFASARCAGAHALGNSPLWPAASMVTRVTPNPPRDDCDDVTLVTLPKREAGSVTESVTRGLSHVVGGVGLREEYKWSVVEMERGRN